MTNQELERRLADAVSRTAPDDLLGVLSRCEPRKGNVIQMTTRKKNPIIRNLIAACLALALVGGGGAVVYQQTYAVTSIVSLDVNPSIELEINKNEKVLSCEGLNAEAKEVLADMNYGADLKGTKLDVAVNALVGALVRNGYLSNISSAILISVEDENQTRAVKLQQELTATVDVVLQEQAANAAVLSQTVVKDTALEKQAKENNISTGKASLINAVMALNSALEFEPLAALSVEELKDMVETGAPGMPIGKAEASRLVREYAGVNEADLYHVEVDAELDDAAARYEVDLYTASGEFEYAVDAYTGAVIRGKENGLAGSKNTGTTPSASATSEPAASAAPSSSSTETGDMLETTEAFDLAVENFKAKHPELSGNDILNDRINLDQDDGRVHYDVEFFVDGYEVDYEIDAYTGSVLSRDTDYEGPRTQSGASGSADIGSDEAKAAALTHAGLTESQVTGMKVRKDYDDGRLEYEIEFWADNTEYDYTIDGSDAKVIGFDSEYHAPAATTDIGKERAKSVALAHAGLTEAQTTRMQVEKDEDDGRIQYEIEFKADGIEYEYTIDAATGTVLEHEKDWDD